MRRIAKGPHPFWIFDFGFWIAGVRNQKSIQQDFVHVLFPKSETLTVACCLTAHASSNNFVRPHQHIRRNRLPNLDFRFSDFRLFGHRITLSALANTLGGIVNPICLAAFRLIMNSNFVGCSTGRSAGLAPFRILSTYVAARRYQSQQVDADKTLGPQPLHTLLRFICREPTFYRQFYDLFSLSIK